MMLYGNNCLVSNYSVMFYFLDLFFHFYKEEQISEILKIMFKFSELKFAHSELNYHPSLFVLCFLWKLGTHTNSKRSQQDEVIQLLCYCYFKLWFKPNHLAGVRNCAPGILKGLQTITSLILKGT